MRYLLTYIITTLLRYFPIPQKTGLFRIGNPDRNSPVLMTGNFRLTVEVVKKAIMGLDLYLLVANSKGINIWCASTGGHFNNHSVISSIKTSGIEDLVDHRRIILPQLAATGIVRNYIREKTGWKIIWGPVDAKDIPEFIEFNKVEKEKRKVSFSFKQRMEMAVAWLFIFQIINTLIFVWGDYLLISSLIVLFTTLAIYLLFPFYANWLIHSPRAGITNPRVLQLGLIFYLVLSPFIFLYNYYDNLGINGIIWMEVYLYIIIFISCIDLLGTTPVYKSSIHEKMEITLDVEKCKGAEFCDIVCPKNCFEIVDRVATIPDKDLCVQCGACIVQCPFDALYFVSNGEKIEPEYIRTHKLNLIV